ncbi:MAG TPA: 50S ribosomal protein L4 [Bacteroidetes bacterium]|nr:50S ribosomal protein L4 [Bacteroidota bacterium]
MKTALYKLNGSKEQKSAELPAHIFEIEPNEHAVYLDVKALMTNARQGNAATKNRALVSGGGKKPWKQKGRGVARAGTNSSPIWRGGGTIFGPRPHDFHQKVNKKVKALARKSVYSAKVKDEALLVVEDVTLQEAKTKEFLSLLKKWEIENKKITLLLSEKKQDVFRSSRNLPNVSVHIVQHASTYDLLDNEILLIEQSAIEKLQEVFKP